jgi:hypothetical protein
MEVLARSARHNTNQSDDSGSTRYATTSTPGVENLLYAGFVNRSPLFMGEHLPKPTVKRTHRIFIAYVGWDDEVYKAIRVY